MAPPGGSARRLAATSSFKSRSSASDSNNSSRARRYSLDSPGKWPSCPLTTSRHFFMSRGLPLRAIASILSYVPTLLLTEKGNRNGYSMSLILSAIDWHTHAKGYRPTLDSGRGLENHMLYAYAAIGILLAYAWNVSRNNRWEVTRI